MSDTKCLRVRHEASDQKTKNLGNISLKVIMLLQIKLVYQLHFKFLLLNQNLTKKISAI